MSNNTTESALTAPEDRDLNNKWKPDQTTPPLTDEETKLAMEEKNVDVFLSKYPKVDRTYADPIDPMQKIGLISFTPAKGAKPNAKGIYGFAKMRGNFATEIEANQKAEDIIRNYDSYNTVYHAYVGRPFPLTESSDYSATTDEIDIRKDVRESVSHNIKQKKKDEYEEINEIKEREEALIEQQKPAKNNEEVEVDPYEEYITLKVKKAQLSWTYLEHISKMKEIKDIIISTKETLDKLDEEHPDFKDSYYKKYLDARNSSGLDSSKESTQNNFMKFMVEDAVLPGIDEDLVISV
jgi:hypothetical protein